MPNSTNVKRVNYKRREESEMEWRRQSQGAEIISLDAITRSIGIKVDRRDQQKAEFLALCKSIELSSAIAEQIWSRMHSLNVDEKNAIAEAYYRAADAVFCIGSPTR